MPVSACSGLAGANPRGAWWSFDRTLPIVLSGTPGAFEWWVYEGSARPRYAASSPRAPPTDLRAQWWRNAKHDDMAMSHGDVMEFLFSEPELLLSEPSRGAFCEQPAGRRAKSRGACSPHRPAAGTVACRRRRALADPNDVSRSIVTTLTKSCFPGRRRF